MTSSIKFIMTLLIVQGSAVGRINPRCNQPFLTTIFLTLSPAILADFIADIPMIQNWTDAFSEAIVNVFNNATAIKDLQKSYERKNATVSARNGTAILSNFVSNVSKMLSKKEEALERLVKAAELANMNHDYNSALKFNYPKAKHLDQFQPKFVLTPDPHFNMVPVNLNASSVHVPTDVYDESPEILNAANWSQSLDPIFRDNYQKDPTVGWQYFSSTLGFFRIFPGMAWKIPKDHVDYYDSRSSSWYIQAATSPKDVVILLDISGSMKGEHLKIAKETIYGILNTLSDDDFFSVMKFAETFEYLDACFNNTMVQANAENKKRITKALHFVEALSIGYMEMAVAEAFLLLLRTERVNEGASCNKAIIMISDRMGDTMEDVFAKYNSPAKKVRFFTYLVGRDLRNSEQARWVACHNYGYFARVSTLADVNNKVQKYIEVLSRPMVLSRPRNKIWTSVYFSESVPGYKSPMMTTVAQPVFDTKPKWNNSGILLGVMGTDIPITEITRLLAPYELGVNGYSFGITNNGYVIFHPDFRPLMDDSTPKPSYNSLLLSEVEISDTKQDLYLGMINRETGSLRLNATMHLDKMRRAMVRLSHYYFAPINGTPFSIGISLPAGYGHYELLGRLKLEDADLSSLETGNVILSPWDYCTIQPDDAKGDQIATLLKYLRKAKLDINFYSTNCDSKLVEELLYDANVTLGIFQAWQTYLHKASSLPYYSPKHPDAIRVAFLGTRAGLSRYWKYNTSDNNVYVPSKLTAPISELYYKRAVENGADGVITFSIQFASERDPTAVAEHGLITASAPVFVTGNRTKDNKNVEAVAAVVGMQISYSHLRRIFFQATDSATCLANETNCATSCRSKEYECYLLDSNGYVVFSEVDTEVGRFYGELEYSVREAMTYSPNRNASANETIFTRIVVFDYQAVCEVFNDVSSRASATVRNIFADIFRILSWIAWTVYSFLQALVLWQFELHFDFHWHGKSAFANAAANAQREQIICHNALNLFNVDRLDIHRFYKGTLVSCPSRCVRSYVWMSVPKTNLILLVTDAKCECTLFPPITPKPQAVLYDDATMCLHLRQSMLRQRPPFCYSHHPDEKMTLCSRANKHQAAVSTVSLIVFLHVQLLLLQALCHGLLRQMIYL